ncbi:hypothetical protein [Bradyrhizobium cytisi]|uniref:Uncharacterized protein n=1 Tax=Bradyrhizobium cytisi TaxID=515489 RepID=A0A5S4WWI4_9BRAD|nr:hypothetical protein [Bradyrhizobium cytisi]TYL85717.1 hypothetical protein FXB38_09165 [Bradyrhizobium cytisi]
MDERGRRIFAEARATLARTAGITVEHRDHSTEYWKRPEPEPVPEPERAAPSLTDSETLRWQKWIDDRIIAAVVGYHESKQMRPVTRAVLKGLVAELRAEMAKAQPQPAEEFFYLDDDGTKQDADLHGPILRAVDHPVDETIMGPIRARNRAKWLAEQKAKRARSARIIDLPNPLRGRRA